MKKKKIITAIIALLGILLCIYLAGVFYFNSHFLFQTTINDIDVSLDTGEVADIKLSSTFPTIELEELDKEGNETLESIDLKRYFPDIKYDSSAILSEQNKFLWPVSLINKNELTCNKVLGTYDESKLTTILNDLKCLKEENVIRSQSASLVCENGKVVLKEAINGNYISEEQLREVISEELKNFFDGSGKGRINLIALYEKPEEKDLEALNSLIPSLQKIYDKTITVTDDEKAVTIDSDELSELVSIIDNKAEINEDRLDDEVYNISSEYDISEYEYIDRSKLKNDLTNTLLSEKDEKVNITWISEVVRRVDVTISEQTLRYYENNNLVMTSPIVSGNPDITDETIHGHFQVQRMKEHSILVGADYTEEVDYWIGFDETGRIYGIHDAKWRDEFGGDIWLTDPSHGCVNMPTDKMAQLYSYLEIGDEIYVHD